MKEARSARTAATATTRRRVEERAGGDKGETSPKEDFKRAYETQPDIKLRP